MYITLKTSNAQITRHNVTQVHYERRDGHEEGPQIKIVVGQINHIYAFANIEALTIYPDHAAASEPEEANCWSADEEKYQ